MQKRLVRLICLTTIMSFLLFGCGKKDATEVAKEPDTIVKDEQQESEIREDTEVKEQETSEKVEENQETEDSTVEENQSEIEEELPNEEVTIIRDDVSIDEYMQSLDPKKPAIVIYNEQEGYKINMQEGQHYQLKENDRILVNNSRDILQYSTSIKTKEFINLKENSMELLPDYSQFDTPHKSIYKIWVTEDPEERNMITCYLNPPTE